MPGTGLYLSPTGRLDAETCGRLRQQLATAFASGITDVTVDLAEIVSLDTTGLGVLAGASRHLRSRGGTFWVAGASPSVATVLRVNGYADLIEEIRPLRLVSGG